MKYTICFDTLCTGFQPILENNKPIMFATQEEAEAELASDPDFYSEDCFVTTLDEIGHKTIYQPKRT